MSCFFKTEGPTNPEDHYALPPLSRIDLSEPQTLIERKKYFVLHAPRQTGKTTCLLALREHLNREGKYFSVYANLEVAQAAREELRESMPFILGEIATSAAALGDPTAAEALKAVRESAGAVCSRGSSPGGARA
jgi:hypothetical protein